MKPSLSIGSLYKRGGGEAGPSASNTGEDANAGPSSVLDVNLSSENLGQSVGAPPGVLPISTMNLSPANSDSEPGTPPNVWGKLASSAPLGAKTRRFLGWLGATLYPLWLPGYLRPEKVRMIDFEMIRSDLPFHAQDRLDDLGLFQVLAVIRYGRLGSALRELFRRARAELWVELPLVRKKFLPLVLCGGFQYVHAIFTQIAFYMHKPLPEPLPDTGFLAFPELGRHNQWVSEAVFGVAFGAFVVWTLTPFFTAKKRFYTVILYARWLMILTMCQVLRILSFTATQLPAPNYHCRSAEFISVKPQGIKDILIVNLKRQTTHGCGDLIFSSHTTFALSFILFYTQYGTYKFMKYFGWLYVFVLSCLIVASRKHYTVDIVVAWYTVPLVFFYMTKRWKIVRDPLAKSSVISAQNNAGNSAINSGAQVLSASGANLTKSASALPSPSGQQVQMTATGFKHSAQSSLNGEEGGYSTAYSTHEEYSGGASVTVSLGQNLPSSSALNKGGPLPPRPPIVRAASSSGMSSPRGIPWNGGSAFNDPTQPALPVSTSPTSHPAAQGRFSDSEIQPHVAGGRASSPGAASQSASPKKKGVYLLPFFQSSE